LPTNFRFPYAAIGFSDFWRRWHISLSTWLRDYLYVSLGGNRRGAGRTYVNLMLTMLIGGLWHGAAWTFVIWGGMHGLFLAGERFARERLLPPNRQSPALLRFGYGLLTLLLVTLTWIWFRAPDAATAWQAFAHLLPTGDGPALDSGQMFAVVGFAMVAAVHWLMRDHNLMTWQRRLPAPVVGIALGLMLAMIVLSPGDNHAFIYFQF
jgi:alginate O-acetyltransferase complex protein AlgI